LTDEFLSWGLEQANRKKLAKDFVVPMAYKRTAVTSNDESNIDSCAEVYSSLPIRGKLVVVFFGNVGHTNDLKTVFDAAKQLDEIGSEVLFIICGAGEKQDQVQSYAESLTNFKYLGWVGSKQINQLMAIADLGLAPYINSKNYTDNFPNKPAEYLSGGLAIATSIDCGPLVRFIHEEDCGFSYSGSSDNLATILTQLVNNPSRVKDMKYNAYRAFNRRLNAQVVYDNFVSDLDELLYNHTENR